MIHRAVLAGDSILLIGLPLPDRSDSRSETKYSSNQASWKTSEMGKAKLEAQSATSATSAFAEVALRFNFLF